MRDRSGGTREMAGKRAARHTHCLVPEPTMVRWKRSQRAVLVTVLPAMANLGAGALIPGQAFGQRPFSWMMFAVGIVQWIVLVSGAVIIAGIDDVE
ncbi:MAG TPA: hypothetical protein VN654_01125 [Vicinamibacterales bacterium]|nr:hypothetical protein [Vicinamibacterales bacterium]